MRNAIKFLILALGLLPAIAAAQVPNFTMPANTLMGRTGIGTGPAQAIPFASLSQVMFGTIPNNTVLGNVSGGVALTASLNATQMTTLCNAFTTSLKGCVPASGGGTINFLRADGTFAPCSIFTTSLSGCVPASGGGTTNFLRADGTFAPCNTFTSSLNGCVLASGGGTSNFLRADGAFAPFVTGGTQGQVLLKNSGTNGDATFRDQCLNIEAFGGNGNGVAANDTAFSNAYSALSASGGCIYFPAGTYLFSSAVSKTMPNSPFSITLRGEGTNASTLLWPNASGGISFTASNAKNTFHIRDLTFMTSQVNSGIALRFVGVGANAGQQFQSDIHDVSVSGDDIGPVAPTLHYWGTGIILHNWASVDVANVNTWGPHQAPSAAGGGIGLTIEGDVGTTSYTTLINISRSSFNYHVSGLTLGDYWQGVTIDQSNFNGEVGINCLQQAGSATATLVLLTITNSQFNCNGPQITFSSPVINPTFTGNTITILGNGQSGIITGTGGSGLIAIGNIFNLAAANTGTFCIAYAGAGGVILGNIFNTCQTPVNLQAASSNVGVSQNRYVGVTSGSNINSGTGNNMGTVTQ